MASVVSRIVLVVTILALSTVAVAADSPRFTRLDALTSASVDWLSVDEGRIAFGAGTRVWIADRGVPPLIRSEITLGRNAHEGVFAGGRLYLNGTDGLRVLDLEAGAGEAVPIRLTPEPRGALHIARMDDYLLVAESGYGLRILMLPPPPGHRMPGHHAHHDLQPIRLLPIREEFTALTASVRTIYLVVEGWELMVINARQPKALRVERVISLDYQVAALAANGSRVHLLDTEGLRIIELSHKPEPLVEGVYRNVRGHAIQLAGRATFVAGQPERGMTIFRDTTVATTTHFVTVSDRVFTPAELVVEIGDTVQWDNVDGFHNVESCDGISDPSECNAGPVAVAAEGAFSSGAPSDPAWSFSKIFNVVGENPYFCVVHVNNDMVGNVIVQLPSVADHIVAVSDFVFTPANLVVNPGDVVQWDNVAGFHNVESCDGVLDPASCGGQSAAEGSFFLAPGPSALPWTFQQIFVATGDNPYFCVVHEAFGMIGNVTTAAVFGPPGVPDGEGPTLPLTVDKLMSGGPGAAALEVSWDVGTCPATDYQIVFGGGSQFPVTPGGLYGLGGGVCSIGTAPPFRWEGSPSVEDDPTNLVWFLVVANDGVGVEGSWGRDSGSSERSGTGAGGSSGPTICHANKNLTNSCGQ